MNAGVTRRAVFVLAALTIGCTAPANEAEFPGETVTFRLTVTSGERQFWHGSPIRDLAVGPGDRWLVSAGADGFLNLWSVRSGRLIRRIRAHEGRGGAHLVVVASEGETIVSAGDDALCAWDSTTGALLWKRRTPGGNRHESPSDGVLCLAADHSGKRIALGRRDGAVELRDPASGRLLIGFAGHPGANTPARVVAWSPDDAWLATGGPDAIHIWAPRTGARIRRLKRPPGRAPLRTIAISPDATLLLTSDSDRSHLLHVETGEVMRSYASPGPATFAADGTWVASGGYRLRWWDTAVGGELHSGWRRLWTVGEECCGVALSPDGSWIVTAGADGIARVWDTATGVERSSLKGHRAAITEVATNGKRIATASEDRTVRVWDAEDGAIFRTFGHKWAVRALDISADGALVAASDSNWVRIWDIDSGRCVRVLTDDRRQVHDLAFEPEGHRVLVADSHALRLWNSSNGELLLTLKGDRAHSVAWARSGKSIIANTSTELRVWDSTTGEMLRRIHTNSGYNSVAAIHGSWGVVLGEDGFHGVWDLRTGQRKSSYDIGDGDRLPIQLSERPWATGLAVDPAGKWTVSCIGESDVRFRNLLTGRRVERIPAHRPKHARSISCMVASRDGAWLATGSRDGSIKLWDPANGSELRPPRGHTRAVTGLALDPNGKWIASASGDRSVRLWDPDTGEPLRVMQGPEPLKRITVTPDGQRLYVVDTDGHITSWDPSTGETAAAWVGDRTRPPFAVAGGGRLVFRGRNGTATEWTSHPRQAPPARGDPYWYVRHIFFVPGRGEVVAVSSENLGITLLGGDPTRIRVSDFVTGKLLRTVTPETKGEVLRAAMSPDGTTLATVSGDQVLTLWDTVNRREIRTLEMTLEPAPTSARRPWAWVPITAIAFTPDGRRVIGCHHDHRVLVWDAGDGKLVGSKELPAAPSCVVTRGNVIWLGLADGTVRCYEMRSLASSSETSSACSVPSEK